MSNSPDLPGWPVPMDRVTIPLPAGITLREDCDCVFVVAGDRIYPLPANVGAAILSLIVEAIANDMALAAELAPNGLAFTIRADSNTKGDAP